MKKRLILVLAAALMAGCTSVGNLGMISRSTADPGAMLRTAHPYKELGPVHDESCRFLLLGALPWGNGTMSAAAEDALAKTGGDAMLNVTVSTSLYGFIPIYNVLSYTCTEVKGIAIKFERPNQP